MYGCHFAGNKSHESIRIARKHQNAAVMTKPRDILKGKVKRLLREQEDMGQLCDPAVDHCVSALEAFVHDIGRRLKSQTDTAGIPVITPIELKRCVLASPDLVFLHHKVQAIDESDAKYYKPPSTRKRKAEPSAAAEIKANKPPSSKSRRKAAADDTSGNAGNTASVEGNQTKPRKPRVTATAKAASKATTVETPNTVEIEEDDNYDSSDSD